MKILVFGMGALGTVYAGLLKQSGHEVYGIDREPVVEAINQQGLQVEGIWGNHRIYPDQVATSLDKLNCLQFDLAIVTVKSYETPNVAQQLGQYLKPIPYIILAQNGYGNFEAAKQYLPEDQIIMGRIIFGAETINPGHSLVTVIADDVAIGSPSNSIDSSYLEELAGMFTRAGIPTRATAEIMQYLWAKIIYNSALNPLGAILEVNYGKLGEMESTRRLMDTIIEEIFAVLKAMDQPTLWPDANAYLQVFYTTLLPSTGGHHASMLQDIQRGRKTEIDALNGAVAALGKHLGVPTPVNAVITQLLKARESI